MWVLRYLRELFGWAFTRYRVHQAIAGLVILVAGLIGVLSISPAPGTVGAYLLCWLAFLMFFVAPARLWHEHQEKLQPSLVFVDHKDNGAVDPNTGMQYARVTVKNTSAVLLTDVEALLAEIEPHPEEFITLHVPLLPIHCKTRECRFSLQPEMHRTVNLLSLDMNSQYADVWHVTDGLTSALPMGKYRMKLMVSTNQTPPIAQWFTVEIGRESKPGGTTQILSVDIEKTRRAA